MEEIKYFCNPQEKFLLKMKLYGFSSLFCGFWSCTNFFSFAHKFFIRFKSERFANYVTALIRFCRTKIFNYFTLMALSRWKTKYSEFWNQFSILEIKKFSRICIHIWELTFWYKIITQFSHSDVLSYNPKSYQIPGTFFSKI